MRRRVAAGGLGRQLRRPSRHLSEANTRVAIAVRSQTSRVILADEPTRHLDTANSERAFELCIICITRPALLSHAHHQLPNRALDHE